jgi:hypothetical protein
MRYFFSASSTATLSHAAVLKPAHVTLVSSIPSSRIYRTNQHHGSKHPQPVDTNQPLRRAPAKKQKKRPALIWGLPLEQQTALTLTFYFQTLVTVKRAESALKASSASKHDNSSAEHWREIHHYHAQAVEQYNTAVTRLLYYTIYLERHPEWRGSVKSLWKSIKIGVCCSFLPFLPS